VLFENCVEEIVTLVPLKLTPVVNEVMYDTK
jgi:hypothetical protein